MNDHQRITDVLARYAHTLDDGDAKGWAGCFTAHARYTLTLPGDDEPAFDVVGRPALEEYRRSRPIVSAAAAWQHVVSGVRVAVDDAAGTATAVSYWTSIAADPVPEILAFGVYRDRLERQPDGTWLLAERRNQTRGMRPT